MAKCLRCSGDSLSSSRICPSCLDNWSKMRGVVFDFLQEKYGKLNPDNHKAFISETKRLEKLWRQDKDKFIKETQKQN